MYFPGGAGVRETRPSPTPAPSHPPRFKAHPVLPRERRAAKRLFAFREPFANPHTRRDGCAATISRSSNRVWLLPCLPTVSHADLLSAADFGAATGLFETHFKALVVLAQISQQHQITFSPSESASCRWCRCYMLTSSFMETLTDS